MPEATFNEVVSELQSINKTLSESGQTANQRFKRDTKMGKVMMSNDYMMMAERTLDNTMASRRGIERLVRSANSGELGTGKFDAEMNEYLAAISEREMINQGIDPKRHEQLLFEIRESLKAQQDTFRTKFDRFFTNNVLAFTNIDDTIDRVFGDNIFDKKRRQREETLKERELFREEESYKINVAMYDFFRKDIFEELSSQTDALEALLRRSPTLAQQEEDKMEALRMRRRARGEEIEYQEPSAPQQREGLLDSIGNILLGAGAVAGLGVLGKIKKITGELKTKVSTTTTEFSRRLFGVPKGTIPTIMDDVGKTIVSPDRLSKLQKAAAVEAKVLGTSVDDAVRAVNNKYVTMADSVIKKQSSPKALATLTSKIPIPELKYDGRLKPVFENATKSLAGVTGPIGKVVPEALKSGLGLIGTGLGKAMNFISYAYAAKDVFDIASAVSSDDVRDKVMAEDVGAVVGSIIGGGLGFFLGGPAGTALGIGIGNEIGERIGKAFERRNVIEEIDNVVESLEERLSIAVGKEAEKIQNQLDKIKQVEDTKGAALKRQGDLLDDTQDKISDLEDKIEEAEDNNNTALLLRLELQLKKEQEKLEREEQNYLKMESAYNDAIARTGAAGLKAAGRGGFLDMIASSQNPFMAAIGQMLGGASQGAAQARTDVATRELADAEAEIREEFSDMLMKMKETNLERAAELGKRIESGELDARGMAEYLKDFKAEDAGFFDFTQARQSGRRQQGAEFLATLDRLNEELRLAGMMRATDAGGGARVVNNDMSTVSQTSNVRTEVIERGGQGAPEKMLQLNFVNRLQ